MFVPKYFVVILSLVFNCITDLVLCGDAPVVELLNGKVKGEEKESRDDRDFFAYRGIPYAKPPIGELRFEAPQKPDNWTGVWDGEDYGKKCIQWSTYEKEVDGDENCLFINVFTPKIGDGISKRLLPVLVFIHGGDFMTGTAEIYRAHYFMDREVVVATFNYRLGAFGFLSTDDNVANGNAGLKDMALALQWIQENVRKFGGDPKRVTLFGQGSGSIAVHLLMLSPMGKGLFKKAISQSGTALNSNSIQTHPLEAAQRLARKLKCDNVLNKVENSTGERKLEDVLSNSTVLVECLRSMKAKKIAEVHEEAFGPFRHPLSLFIPSIEKPQKHYNDTNELPFMTEHPFAVILSGRQAKVPWMVGYNVQEGLAATGVVLNDKSMVSFLEDNWDELSPQMLAYPRSRTDLTKRIKQFYLSSKDYEFENDGTGGNGTQSTGVQPASSPHPHPSGSTTRSGNVYRTTEGTTPSPYAVYETEEPTISFEEQFKSFTNMFTDRYYVWPMFESVHLQVQNPSPIYLYENMYEGQHTLLDVYTGKSKEPAPAMKKVKNWFKTNILGRKIQAPKHLGVCTGDELPLLFKYPDLKIKENTKDYEASKELVKTWVQFASNDNQLTYRNITWTPISVPNYESDRVIYSYQSMRFHNVAELSGMKSMSESLQSRLKFWKKLEYMPLFNQ